MSSAAYPCPSPSDPIGLSRLPSLRDWDPPDTAAAGDRRRSTPFPSPSDCKRGGGFLRRLRSLGCGFSSSSQARDPSARQTPAKRRWRHKGKKKRAEAEETMDQAVDEIAHILYGLRSQSRRMAGRGDVEEQMHTTFAGSPPLPRARFFVPDNRETYMPGYPEGFDEPHHLGRWRSREYSMHGFAGHSSTPRTPFYVSDSSERFLREYSDSFEEMPHHLGRRRIREYSMHGFAGHSPTPRTPFLVSDSSERFLREYSDSFEEMVMPRLLLGGIDFYDRFKDLRLDVDNMSYEELLELSDSIGYVSTGLREEEIVRSLRNMKHSTCDSLSLRFTEKEPKCSICQEDYELNDDTGKLHCGHIYHMPCIKEWLQQRNACPLCKTAVYKT